MLFFLSLSFIRFAIAESSADWAFFASEDRAKEIYAKKQIQIPCERIDELLRKDDINGVYIAIRDAALFGDKQCDVYIKKNLSKLKKLDGAKDAVAFYYYKNGDPSGLTELAESFDKNHNDFIVELFGFFK